MNEENFLPLTLEEYQSLIRLKKAGVRWLEMFFHGSYGVTGYDRLWFGSYSKTIAEDFEEDFKRIKKYLYRNLDARSDISFDGSGCQGRIDIDLTKDEFLISLKTQVPAAWQDDVCVSAKIAPATELEALAAEVSHG